ncbi:substrate-binding domain-containing protein [Xenophilus arseniciresistens]|uniref:Substrate-binding domain-containing protein n=1 Tax=Xenophilus arseniciresistens TaxID=1283306 RepID=A0AAE3NBI7_9BURK|nr:substrate-binding domain-containing protein [Xenophilus arseniciresistens]MDA7417282.1 substrate-binding domain-containing protein [Xenophilus arseniciresistens]
MPPTIPFLTRRLALIGGALALAGCTSLGGRPAPADIHVMTSGGFTAAYNDLRPGFEKQSGHSVKTAYGASMGNASDSIPSRLGRGEPADVVILARPALDALVKDGKVVAGSQVDLVRSSIGLVVRQGQPRPDVSSVEALKRTLLAAPSVAYSASASGTYYETELLKKLGIEAEVKPKSRRILSERVGTVVARGDAALGLQQISELLPIPGVDYIGPLPAEVQRVTVFSAGITTSSKQPAAARELIRYLTSPGVAPAIAKTGLEPITAK